MNERQFYDDMEGRAEASAELDALRLALAASEARENALREALATGNRRLGYWCDLHGSLPEDRAALTDMQAALSAPRDSAALRAFGEKCAEAGQKDSFDEISAMDAGVPRKQQDAAAIVARILSGGQS